MADECNSWFDCSNLKSSLSPEQLFKLLITKGDNDCPSLRIAGTFTSSASSTRRTPSRTLVTSSGAVAAGSRSVSLETSDDFVGTILGVSANPSTVYNYAVNQNDDDLDAIAYVITSGSIIINKIV